MKRGARVASSSRGAVSLVALARLSPSLAPQAAAPPPKPQPQPTRLPKQARYSNYNFCNRKRGFDANVKEAHGALMSFVVRGELNRSSWELAGARGSSWELAAGQAEAVAPGLSAAAGVTAAAEAAAGGGGGGLRLWREVNAAFPVSLDEMVSGPEDPRVLRLDDGATLVPNPNPNPNPNLNLKPSPNANPNPSPNPNPNPSLSLSPNQVLVAVWEATKVQWQHALEIPGAEAPEGGDGRGGGEGGGGRGGGGVPVATRLEVDLRYAQLLRVWLTQFRQTSELRSREKNWSPFRR